MASEEPRQKKKKKGCKSCPWPETGGHLSGRRTPTLEAQETATKRKQEQASQAFVVSKSGAVV